MMVSMSNEDAKKWFMPQSSSQQRHRPEKPLHRRGWLFDCVAQLVSLCPSTPELHSAAILLAGGTNNSLLLVCRVAQQHSAPRRLQIVLPFIQRSITHTEAVATHQCLSWLLANCWLTAFACLLALSARLCAERPPSLIQSGVSRLSLCLLPCPCSSSTNPIT